MLKSVPHGGPVCRFFLPLWNCDERQTSLLLELPQRPAAPGCVVGLATVRRRFRARPGVLVQLIALMVIQGRASACSGSIPSQTFFNVKAASATVPRQLLGINPGGHGFAHGPPVAHCAHWRAEGHGAGEPLCPREATACNAWPGGRSANSASTSGRRAGHASPVVYREMIGPAASGAIIQPGAIPRFLPPICVQYIHCVLRGSLRPSFK